MNTLRQFDTLKNILKNPLPGEMAQVKMSPSVRTANLGNLAGKEHQKSSVLILLYPSLHKLYTVFIKRTQYNGVHSGQVGLPGGKFEPSDKHLIQTALRETYEELGIEQSSVDILGRLTQLYIPASQNLVTPFVGGLKEKPVFTPCTREVEYIIEMPLQELIHHKIETTEMISNETIIRAPYFKAGNDQIWGATAMILSEFIEVLKEGIILT